MPDQSSKSVLLMDHGLFLSWAMKLSEYFGEISYFVPWDGLFPDMSRALIGDGFPKIKRVQNFFEAAKRADLIVFPDVYNQDVLNVCRYQLKKPCWGSGRAEELELDRWRSWQLLKKLGLPAVQTERVIGVDALRRCLRKNEDKYIKISRYRGVGETFHHVNYRLSEPWIDEKAHKLGRQQHLMPFMVQDSINSDCEPGWDGYIVDGQTPRTNIVGFEVKDKSYFCSVLPAKEMFAGLSDLNEALAATFKKYQYRGWFSSEVRVDGKKSYPIDLTCRAASPAGETYQELITNWGEILWHGAQGEIVEPKFGGQYGMQIIIKAAAAEHEWLPVYFPEKLSRWVKLYNACRLKGQTCVIPQEGAGLIWIGSVVAIGDTPEQCKKRIKEYADQVEGYQVEIDVDTLNDAEAVADEAEKSGVQFYSKRRVA